MHCTCNNLATADLQCHVHLLDAYISKLPPSTVTEQGTFYLRPLQKPKDGVSPWFSSVPVGKNTLSAMLKKMCPDAGISGNQTNHSLRATGATEMFQAQVPEKIIQERTGHRPLAALRTYEHNTEKQHRAVSSVLSSSSHHSYKQAIQNFHQANIDLNFQPNTAQVSGTHISFQSVTGCTVNIYQTPMSAAAGPGAVHKPTGTVHPPDDQLPLLGLSENDLELFMKDLESDYTL